MQIQRGKNTMQRYMDYAEKHRHRMRDALAMALGNGGEKAKSIIENYQPDFASMQAYFEFVDKLALDCQAVSYEGDHQAALTFGQ